MAFTPVFFSKIGKAVTDLFDLDEKKPNNKFDNKKGFNALTFRSKSGLAALAGLSLTHSTTLRGSALATDVEALYTNADFGSAKLVTKSNQTAELNVTLDKLQKGLKVKVDGKTEDKSVNVTAEYTQSPAVVSVKADPLAKSATASVCVGFEGVSAGVQVEVKPGKAPEPKASKPAADATGSTEQKDAPAPANEIVYDAGLQYQKGDITAALTTSKCIQQLNASLLYKVNKNASLAAFVSQDLKGKPTDAPADWKAPSPTVLVGGKVNCGSDIVWSGKVALLGANSVNMRVEHAIRSWANLAVVASVADIKSYSTPSFGVALTLGEKKDDE